MCVASTLHKLDVNVTDTVILDGDFCCVGSCYSMFCLHITSQSPVLLTCQLKCKFNFLILGLLLF